MPKRRETELGGVSAPLAEARHGECKWKPDSDGTYETSCGQAFVFTDGGPHQNGANFCMYCGGVLKEQKYRKRR
jgi:hypothetical protein